MKRVFAALAFVAGLAWSIPANARDCDAKGLCCDEWVIDLREAGGGKIWGEIGDKSLASAVAKLEKARAFDRRYCRWAGLDYPCDTRTHDDAGAPRCAGASANEQLCSKAEFLARIEKLEAEARGGQAGMAAKDTALQVLQRGAAAAGLGFLEGAGSGLKDYGEAFGEVLARVRKLRETLSAMPDALCGANAGTGSGDIPSLWGDAGEFGGHVERTSRNHALARELTSLEKSTVVHPRPAIAVSTLDLAGMTNAVRVVKRVGAGRLIFGEMGTAADGSQLRAGALPVAFLWTDAKGERRFGRVSIERKRGPKGSVVMISGTGGGAAEVVEITEGAPDRDRDGVTDPDDACPDVAGIMRGCPPPTPTPTPLAAATEELFRATPVATPVSKAKAGDPCAGTTDCTPGSVCYKQTCVGSGELRFSLSWSADTDIDLHVITPSGARIFHQNRQAAGGALDVDDCVGGNCKKSGGPHIENVVFTGAPAVGFYSVHAVNHAGQMVTPVSIEVFGGTGGSFTDIVPSAQGATGPTHGIAYGDVSGILRIQEQQQRCEACYATEKTCKESSSDLAIECIRSCRQGPDGEDCRRDCNRTLAREGLRCVQELDACQSRQCP